ncbi:alkylglycerol monooxygenase-like [Portunus trituberculatus]|uniref:alkylglycerol monooxygenase-like n=1 Tax=Portunus trituberculatus TaxID=210409 RepID=UPI001E1D0C40|nr:alkylglycerol monooxygenase-like [Portunus trituberculatus]
MAANTTFFPPADLNLRVRAMFYALTPEETYAEHFQDMADVGYIARPFFIVWVLIDLLLMVAMGKREDARLHHVFINLTVGHITEAGGRFLSRGLELTAYLWIYHHHRLFSQPFDSLTTYLLCVIGVDLCTYWWHRMSHENSVMWAAHYLHHSCEDLNPSVSARISLTMLPLKWVYYLPLAFLGVPPPVYVIHNQMNFYFGAWEHSRLWPKMHKIIPGLGHLIEFFVVTPSHHRVHHASNKYCIDKNYGSLLIIWDRIFGTFEEEREGEELVYGVIDQKEATHIIGLQLNPWWTLWERFSAAKTPGDKLRTLLYGPGWSPGQSRLGNPDDIPDVRGRKKHEFEAPAWFSFYLFLHCSLVVLGIIDMATRMRAVSRALGLVHFFYVVLAGSSLGGLFSSHLGSLKFEPLRLLLSIPLCFLLPVFACRPLAVCIALTSAVSLPLWPLVGTQALKMAEKKETRKVE